MAKKTEQIILDSNIIENSMEEVMHNSFMTYAEYVILERALPRAEDGMKPVQRRILYTMSTLGLSPDKPYKKSAKVVGEALAKYHPHGDTSVYDAMVRLAQNFAMRYPLADGQGNFGSMDGDGAAAMRYTEARMSPLALEMLKDLDKDTVPFRPNYDDSEMEPDMLPARFPNLLVNGSSGIAVGLATNIPPHNLGESIDAAVFRMNHPDCTLDEVLSFIKGPDFPTGGLILDNGELRAAYETGKGKILIRAKAHIEKGLNGKSLIVITDIPFEIKKSAMLQKMFEISEQKKDLFAGIDDIRDESDREGIRAVVEIKKGYDAEKILALLYKYTDLQITFGINMMVIADGVPVQAGLLDLLDYYVKHQKNVVSRRTRFDLEKAEKKEHILAGYIIAVADIDRVVKIIRGSSDTKDARQNLMKEFGFTSVQAQAILDMRLARLTSLEIVTLRQDYEDVKKLIKELKSILDSDSKLIEVISREMYEIKDRYGDDRRTGFVNADSVDEVDEKEFKVIEECAVVLNSNGNLKRMSLKALQKGLEAGIDEKNEPKKIINITDDKKLYIFTSFGNLYRISVDMIPEGRIKDPGKHLSTMFAGIEKDENIVNIFDFDVFSGELLFVTKLGMSKKLDIAELDIKKTKAIVCGLKENDRVCTVEQVSGELYLLVVTSKGMAINFSIEHIPVQGRNGKGVGSIKFTGDDYVVYSSLNNGKGANLIAVTNTGYAKKTSLAEYDVQGRNGKGLKTFALGGEAGDSIVWAFLTDKPCRISVMLKNGESFLVNTDSVPVSSRNSKGEPVVLSLMGNDVVNVQNRIISD